jgi:glycerol-3-phosphate dehydrogenase
VGLVDHDFDALGANIAQEHDLPSDVGKRLANVYGSRGRDVAAYAARDRELAARICPERDVIYAEVAHAVERELAVCLEDVLVRRTPIALTADDQGLGAAERVADLMGGLLGWDEARRQKEIEGYRHAVALTRVFRE